MYQYRVANRWQPLLLIYTESKSNCNIYEDFSHDGFSFKSLNTKSNKERLQQFNQIA